MWSSQAYPPHRDAAFDRGFIMVQDDGAVLAPGSLHDTARELLGLRERLQVRVLSTAHRVCLRWHRVLIFKGHPDGLPSPPPVAQ